VWFAVLAASPVTTVFATIESGNRACPMSTDTLVPDDTWLKLKVVADGLVAGALPWNIRPQPVGGSAGRSPYSTADTDRQPALHSILRL